MSGPNPTLTKSFVAGAAITKRRLVKFGSADGEVLHAAAVSDAICGIAAELDVTAGRRVDVHVTGIAEAEYGGTITRGDAVTADASGRAVAASPSSGANNRIAGFAMVSGVAGDIGTVLLAPGRIQG